MCDENAVVATVFHTTAEIAWIRPGRLHPFGGNNNSAGGGWSSGAIYTNIGSKASNDYGIFDLNGNVRELTLDWYQADVSWNYDGRPNAFGYAFADGITPRTSSDSVVAKGGCYASYMKDCRAASRESVGTGIYTSHTGFRCVTRSLTR